MKKILSFSGFEALNERILISPDEDRRLKDEVLPKIKAMLADYSLWTAGLKPSFIGSEGESLIPKNSIPFKYKMASGEEAVVHFVVVVSPSKRRFNAMFLPLDTKDLKDNIIGINSDLRDTLYNYGTQIPTDNSAKAEKDLLSHLKHELIHAKDPGLNQYQYSNFDHPKNYEAYLKRYLKTKSEGIAFGGELLEYIKDRVEEFVQGGLTEEKVQTLNSVLNDLANGYIEPSDLSPETIDFLDYSKDIENSIWIGKSNSIRAVKALRDNQNLEFRKFQKKFYQEIVRIAAEINSDLSTKYPQIKGRIKVSASQS